MSQTITANASLFYEAGAQPYVSASALTNETNPSGPAIWWNNSGTPTYS